MKYRSPPIGPPSVDCLHDNCNARGEPRVRTSRFTAIVTGYSRYLLLCGLLVAFEAPAQGNFSVWLSGNWLDFDYAEYDDTGTLLDREDGWLPGLEAGISHEQHGWFAQAGLGWWRGSVDYAAAMASATSDAEIIDGYLHAGREVYVRGGSRAQLLAGIGYRDWQRDIAPASPFALFENYSWWYGTLGVRLSHVLDERTTLSASVLFNRPIDPEVDVEFAAGFDPVSLELGEHTGYRLALVLERRMGEGISVRVSPWYESWDLGRSVDVPLTQNGTQAGGQSVHEPRSETGNIGLSLGLTWFR